ncbi:MAG: radical SAM family heme chaperone HemW [Tannerellaceae bacterium]|jgi:oxygen-independent coproporphyrinogen-3 oxidase|nr:radical SAM family heme chaperone HemW [Tannerellaceae bacterium]
MAGLYIHIPFCLKRCIYCDFFSHTQMRHKEAYLSALATEMAMRKDYTGDEAIETVYFGGGTPSLLTASDFGDLFDAIYRLFDVSKDAEITIEANPDDMTPAYVSSLRRLPFNRISMGVQSFSDEDLRFLCRRHTGRQATEAVRICKDEGYDNISIDLIYGLPGQTPGAWEDNLEKALRLDTPHISAYHLTYEKDTPLYRLKEEGRIQPVDEDVSLSLFEQLTNRMANAGYLHYEISSFARPGYLSLHNSAYWTGKKYLGLGPSAHSYDTQSRQWNVASVQRYIEGIEDKHLCAESEHLDDNTKYNEYIMTRLRTLQGIDTTYIRTTFGEDKHLYCKTQAQTFINNGMLCEEGERLKLSAKALFVSDSIISHLLRIDSYTKHGV